MVWNMQQTLESAHPVLISCISLSLPAVLTHASGKKLFPPSHPHPPSQPTTLLSFCYNFPLFPFPSLLKLNSICTWYCSVFNLPMELFIQNQYCLSKVSYTVHDITHITIFTLHWGLTDNPKNFPDLCCVDALDLYVCFEVMVAASGENLNGESTGSILHHCCLTTEAGAHHLLTQDEDIGHRVDSHHALLVTPLERKNISTTNITTDNKKKKNAPLIIMTEGEPYPSTIHWHCNFVLVTTIAFRGLSWDFGFWRFWFYNL